MLRTKEEIAADAVQVVPALTAYATGDKQIMRGIWDAAIYNLHQPPVEDYELYLDASLKQRNLVDVDYSLLTFNMTDSPTGSAPGSGRLALVSCPVSILHGEKDSVVPIDWGRKIVELLGERAEMTVFPDSGHSPMTDDPGAFFKAVREALSR